MTSGQVAKRSWRDRVFEGLGIAALLVVLLSLGILLMRVWIDGSQRIGWSFLTSYPSRFPEEAGILAPLVGTVYLMLLTILISVPIGVGAAVFLEEYVRDVSGATGGFVRLLEEWTRHPSMDPVSPAYPTSSPPSTASPSFLVSRSRWDKTE